MSVIIHGNNDSHVRVDAIAWLRWNHDRTSATFRLHGHETVICITPRTDDLVGESNISSLDYLRRVFGP